MVEMVKSESFNVFISIMHHIPHRITSYTLVNDVNDVSAKNAIKSTDM